MADKKRTLRLNLLAMFIAIIVLQTSIPLIGYIPIGPLSITIIPATVVIATILMGTRDGAIIGGVWGFITFIRAYGWPTSPLAAIVFVNPIVSVVPRILIGVVAGITYHALMKLLKRQSISISVAAVLGSLTNTILVLGLIYLFYKAKAPQLYQINTKELMPYLLGVVGTNGVPEAIFSGIVTPLIVVPLKRVLKDRLD
ncbi:ECF transporter S component [Lentilactobacillus farraginis]|uniref:Integral membrane protein n=1 Tax=Lentilactobacillus farraginis DSM 18382 = JCM 14108 TaxID=1423743 RepID=X0PIV3_9LACO|nr:ECF transporter S component [Lentilactobacillus farraginis]KRM09528.1 integral membrane protein [Lentilactobacillus farraginis DSM 18382 = JCM 14108]GAF36461.1 substrate-specific component PanT of predicted pantothenate ECF transporter [Lentilactobacillus farraginis DSM 18382 = JCM 14108]